MTCNQTGASGATIADAGSSPRPGAVPGLVEVRATRVSPPPGWALLPRYAVEPMVDKAEKGGAFYYADDVEPVRKGVQLEPVLRQGADRSRSTSGCSNGTQPRGSSPTEGGASIPDPQRVLQPGLRRCAVVPPGRGQHGPTISASIPPFRKTCAAPGRAMFMDGSRGPQLRSTAQDLPLPHSDQRRPHAPRNGRQRDHCREGKRVTRRDTAPTRCGPPLIRW